MWQANIIRTAHDVTGDHELKTLDLLSQLLPVKNDIRRTLHSKNDETSAFGIYLLLRVYQ